MFLYLPNIKKQNLMNSLIFPISVIVFLLVVWLTLKVITFIRLNSPEFKKAVEGFRQSLQDEAFRLSGHDFVIEKKHTKKGFEFTVYSPVRLSPDGVDSFLRIADDHSKKWSMSISNKKKDSAGNIVLMVR